MKTLALSILAVALLSGPSYAFSLDTNASVEKQIERKGGGRFSKAR